MGNCVQSQAHVVEYATSEKFKRNTTFHGDDTSVSSTDHSAQYYKNTCALEYWEPVSLLGDGSVSTVYLAKRRPRSVKIPYMERSDVMTRAQNAVEQSHACAAETVGSKPELCALKTIHHDNVGKNTILRDAKNEIAMLRKLSHPNIIRLLEGYERRRHVYMATEVCRGGDLHQAERTTEDHAKSIVRQILAAVAYLHQVGVVHRDLKLQNVLFADSERTNVKIIDFGMAVEHSPYEEKLTQRVGTIYSIAPEVLKGSYDYKCDVWSIGVIAYTLLSGNKPFWGNETDMPWTDRRTLMMERILQGDYTNMEGDKWTDISTDAKAFVKSLLELDPNQRPTAEDALSHPWVQTDDLDMDL